MKENVVKFTGKVRKYYKSITNGSINLAQVILCGVIVRARFDLYERKCWGNYWKVGIFGICTTNGSTDVCS